MEQDFFQVVLHIPKRGTAIKNTTVHLLRLPAPPFSLRCAALGAAACLRLGRLPAPKADPPPTCPPENQATAFFSYF